MEKLWEPPAGEICVCARNFGNKILVFTDKGVYSVEPIKTPWYKKLWRKLK